MSTAEIVLTGLTGLLVAAAFMCGVWYARRRDAQGDPRIDLGDRIVIHVWGKDYRMRLAQVNVDLYTGATAELRDLSHYLLTAHDTPEETA